jgi:hypothetical protein
MNPVGHRRAFASRRSDCHHRTHNRAIANGSTHKLAANDGASNIRTDKHGRRRKRLPCDSSGLVSVTIQSIA